MAKQKSSSHHSEALRKKAENFLAERGEIVSPISWKKDNQGLAHELSVHHIELEMQNDELRRAQEQLEESRERYVDLYENAPVGYLTLDEKGIVSDLNLTATHLLGIKRPFLLRKPFTTLIAPESQDIFYLHRRAVLRSPGTQICELMLRRKKGGEQFFHGRLESIAVQINGATSIRTVLTDVTERRQFEKEREMARQQLEQRVKERTAELQAEIAERKRIEKDLQKAQKDAVKRAREAEERAQVLTAMMDHIPMGITIADAPDVKIRTVSRYGRELLGKAPELLEGIPVDLHVERWGIYHKDGVTPAQNEELPLTRATQQGELVKGEEWVVMNADGTRIPVLCTAGPIYDENGHITGGVIGWQDITERKRMEESLRQSEANFRTMADAIPQLAWIARPDGYIFWYNQRWYDYTGTTPEEMEGWGWQRVHDPDALPRVLEQWKASIATGMPFDMIFPLRGANGRFRQFLTRVMPLKDDFGKVIQWFGTNTDITERKQLEEELRRSRDELELRVEERAEELQEANTALQAEVADRRKAEYALGLASAYNRSLIEASIDPLVTINQEGRISDVNAATEQVTGYSRTELIGSDFSDYFTEPSKARDGYRRVFDEGLVRDYPLEIRHRDGHATPVTYNASVYRDEAGDVIGVFAAARDMTDLKQLEQQLRHVQKMEALGTLSGGVAHDFNNILAAIIGFTELMTDGVRSGSREAHYLERVMEAAMRGRDLVKQMLTFSRKAEQEKRPLSLSSIVKETVNLIRATTPTTISIRVNARGGSGPILADPTQIQQVIMNLCTNATHAMREKGGSLDIHLGDFTVSPSNGDRHGIRPGVYVKLTVRDTGTGMSPDITEKIFDPFFTTKKLGEGTGLGLSVVHGIVTQHDGYITVESKPGKGSLFTVYFPRTAGESETHAVSDDEIPTGTERILYVDDEEALVEMGEYILSGLGYDVTSRMSSREALSLLKEDPYRFDMVITDQTMPEMTGVELAKEILALRGDMPIIMCTGFSHLVDADKARAAGIRAFVMKPLTKREIAKAVRRVLDKKETP